MSIPKKAKPAVKVARVYLRVSTEEQDLGNRPIEAACREVR